MGKVRLLLYPSGRSLLLLATFHLFCNFQSQLFLNFIEYPVYILILLFFLLLWDDSQERKEVAPALGCHVQIGCSHCPTAFSIFCLNFLIFHFLCSQSLSWNCSFENHTLCKSNVKPLQHLIKYWGQPLHVKLPWLFPPWNCTKWVLLVSPWFFFVVVVDLFSSSLNFGFLLTPPLSEVCFFLIWKVKQQSFNGIYH